MEEITRKPMAPRLGLVLVILLSLAVRVLVTMDNRSGPLFDSYRLDETLYLEWARQASEGDPFLDYVPIHGPGYPWALGLLYAAGGDEYLTPRVLNSALGIGSIILVYCLAASLAGPWAGVFAALLIGLYWPMITLEQRVMGTALFVFLNLLSLKLATWAARRDAVRRWALCGLAIGAAAVTRPNSLVWLAVLAAWLAVAAARSKSGRRAASVLALAGAALLPMAPVAIHNHGVSGDWIPVQADGGLNFYLGNNPESNGTPYARPGGKWDAIEARPFLEAGAVSLAEQDGFYTREVLRFLAERPLAFLFKLARKCLLILNNREMRATFDPAFLRGLSKTLSAPFPGFWLIFALAAAGIFSLRPWRTPSRLVLLFVGSHAAAVVATVVSCRYRLAVTAGLAILAGAGAARTLRAVKSVLNKEDDTGRLKRELAFTLALAAAGAALSFLPVAPRHGEAESLTYLGDAWLQKKDMDRAREYYSRALASEPDYAPAMSRLSRLEENRGDLEAALTWLETSVAADPDGGSGHYELSRLYWRLGRREQALLEARLAADKKPLWADGLMNLAVMELNVGRLTNALAAADRLLEIRPDLEDAKRLRMDAMRSLEAEKKKEDEK